MSDTPRTDAQGYGDGRHPYVSTEFARELERELAREKQRAEENGKLAHNLGIKLSAITGEEGELWELRQENARLKDNLASLSKIHAKEAEDWNKRENWRMSSVCRGLRAELDAAKAELADLRDGFDADGRTAAEACCVAFKREQVERIKALEQELEQARQDAKQSDLDAIRALGERNDARKELAAERELADRLAEALLDIEGRASDESVALHPDADAKAFVDDCWEWSEQALAAYKAARDETRH